MDYTPEQLGAAYKKAIAAGDTNSANEIATALNSLVAQQAPAAAPATPASAPTQTASVPEPALDMLGSMYGTSGGQDVGAANLSRPAAANMVRFGGPFLTSLAIGSRLGAGGQMVTGAPAGALFETLALKIEGKPVTKEKVGAAAIYNMAPGVLPFSVATYSTAKNVIGLLGNALTQGSINLATSSLGQYVETGKVDQKTSSLAAGIGLFAGGAGSIGKRMEANVAAVEQAKRIAQDAGIPFSEIPVQYVAPFSGKYSDRLVPIVDSVASQKDAAFREMMKSRLGSFAGDLPEGGAIAKELQAFVDTLDETQKTFAKQSNEAATAMYALKQAEDNLAAVNMADPVAVSTARQNLSNSQDVLRAVRARDISRASAAFALGVTPEGAVFSPSQAAGVWENRIRKPMDNFLKEEAGRRFDPKNIGITPTQTLLSVNDLNDAVAAVKKRLNVGENELGFNLTSNYDEGASLSLNDIRKLRSQLMDKLDNAQSGNTRADAIILQLDAEIANKTRGAIKGIAGDAGLNAYDSANAYYRSVMQAKTNPQGRALLGRQVNDEAAAAMVSKLVSGNYDEYNAALRYIDTIAIGAPDIQKGMKARLNGIVRDSLVSKNTLNPGSETQSLNVSDLFKDLQGIASRKTRQGVPFRVEELGFGSLDQIKSARNLLGGFVGNTMTEQELKQFYRHPAVVEALSSGVGFSDAAKRAAAEIGAAKDLYASSMLNVSGAKKEAEKAYLRAQEKARVAGFSLAQTQELIDRQMQDPVLNAFSGGKTFGLRSGDVQPDFSRFLDFMTNPNTGTNADKTKLAQAIEKQYPQLWNQVKSRFLVDKLYTITNPRNPNMRTDLDYQSLDLLLNPVNSSDRGAAIYATRLILGDETYGNLKKMAPMISKVAYAERVLGGSRPGAAISQAAGVVGAARGYAQGKMQGGVGAESSFQKLYGFIEAGRGKLAAFFIQNPVAYNVYRATGSITQAVSSVGSQRAALSLSDPELAYLVGEESKKSAQ